MNDYKSRKLLVTMVGIIAVLLRPECGPYIATLVVAYVTGNSVAKFALPSKESKK